MKPVFRSSLPFASIAIVSLAWCGDSYSIRVRNNSSSNISLEVKQVGRETLCGESEGSTTYSIRSGETHDLVCSSSSGSSGFCLRDSASHDWKRLDCIDHPLQDVIELDLFGR